jgi:hypothetical protein
MAKLRSLESWSEPNIDLMLRTLSGIQLFIVIIVIVLNVHDTFAGPFKRTTTPSANTFIYSLVHMSNAHIGNDTGVYLLQGRYRHL